MSFIRFGGGRKDDVLIITHLRCYLQCKLKWAGCKSLSKAPLFNRPGKDELLQQYKTISVKEKTTAQKGITFTKSP